MRIPRWILWSLWVVSMFVLFALPTWFWFSWPERTAREFAYLISQRKFDEANSMMTNGRWSTPADHKLILVNSQTDDELCNLTSVNWTAWSERVGSGVRLFAREPNEFLDGKRHFTVGTFPILFTAAHGSVEVPFASGALPNTTLSNGAKSRITFRDGEFVTTIEWLPKGFGR